MTHLLFLIALAMGDPNAVTLPLDVTMYTPDFMVYCRVTGFEPTQPLKFDIQSGSLKVMTNKEKLGFFMKHWLNPDFSKGPQYNLLDFRHLAAHWHPVDKYVPDPNAPQELIGWTIGGKIHLYPDCRYLKGKDDRIKPVKIEDPNNVCLSCIAEKARKDEK